MKLKKGDVYICTEPYCKAEIKVRRGAETTCPGKFNLRCCCGKDMVLKENVELAKSSRVLTGARSAAAILFLAASIAPIAMAQDKPAQSGKEQQAQQRDRVRTPGSEPSAAPAQNQAQKRDRIHTPGTAQPDSPAAGTQQRDRVRTPGSEPSGPPKRGQDKDKMQNRDRIHTPGTGQTGSPGMGTPGGKMGGRRGGK